MLSGYINKTNGLFGLILFLQTAGFVGSKSWITTYLFLSGNLNYQSGLYDLYDFASLATLAAGLAGGVLGDLLIGNKKSLMLGGFIQTLGAAWLIVFPGLSDMGSMLIGIGFGLFISNFYALFSKRILNQRANLDASFTFLFLSAAAGGFLGSILLNAIGRIEWPTLGLFSFIVLFVLFLSTALISIYKLQEELWPIETEGRNTGNLTKVILIFAIVFIVESGNQIAETLNARNLQAIFEVINYTLWQGILLIIFSAILFSFWNKIQPSRRVKVIAGIILSMLSMGITIYIIPMSEVNKIVSSLSSIICFSLGSALLFPTLRSLLVLNTNPKYLTLNFGLFLLVGGSHLLINMFIVQLILQLWSPN